MRHLVLLGAVVALLAFAGTSTAAAPPKSFQVTLTGNVTKSWNANSCCAWAWELEGTTTIPSLGHVRFTGEYFEVYVYPYDGVPPVPSYSVGLGLTFVAANGDQFAIGGQSGFISDDVQQPPPTVWTLRDPTGRFADRSMSGTFQIQGKPNGNTNPLVFTFTGTITGA